MIFASEKRTITKFDREPAKITPEYVANVEKWITDRDIKILKLLLFNPFMTSEQIGMIVFGNLKPSSWQNKANERLRRLYHYHCVDRFFPPVEKDAGSSVQHLILDHCGAKILQKHYDRKEFKWRKRGYIPQDYKHRLKITDFFALLHIMSTQLGVGHELVKWKTVVTENYVFAEDGKVKKYTLLPDAFFVYHCRNKIKICYLECDNATESIEVLKGKLHNYKRFYERGEWKQRTWGKAGKFPTVLFAFHDQSTVDEMISYVKTLRCNIRFLFTTYDQLIVDSFKIYINSAEKKRKVLQERNVQILDSIWMSKDGLVTL